MERLLSQTFSLPTHVKYFTDLKMKDVWDKSLEIVTTPFLMFLEVLLLVHVLLQENIMKNEMAFCCNRTKVAIILDP